MQEERRRRPKRVAAETFPGDPRGIVGRVLNKGAMITRATAHEFRIPSSRGRRVGDPYDHNVIVRLDAVGLAATIQGVGEASPRGRSVTGDDQQASWRFLRSALDRVEGVTISSDPAQSRAEISVLLADLGRMAADIAPEGRPEPPFRGMLTGLDAALVDIAAKVADVPMVEFLGGSRRSVAVAGIVDALSPADKLRRRIRACIPGPAVKVIGVAEREPALNAALAVAAEAGPSVPVWLELAGSPGQQDLRKLMESLADRMIAGELPRHILLQHPGGADHAWLAELQAAADHLVPPDDAAPGIVIMPDVTSPVATRAVAGSGIRGAHLNPQRIGGSLAVLDIAAELRDQQAAVRVGVSTVPQVSDVGARALVELAAALPGMDYCGIGLAPPGGSPALTPPVTFDDERRVVPGQGAGIGGTLGLAPVVQHLARYAQGSRTTEIPPTFEGRPANRFDTRPLALFTNARGGMSAASPLLERAALQLGLNTIRLDRKYFMFDHPELSSPIGLRPNSSMFTGIATHRTTHDKELTREVLQDAGVPVPQGAAFQAGQIEEAVQFAASLPVPVVVKPRAGVHGLGVSTDLRTESEVRTAIATLNTTKFRGKSFVVEEFVQGDDYRLLVVGDRVVSVVLKRAASVVGDGFSTVVELVLQKNRWRLEHPHGRGCLLELGRDSAYWLAKQGLTQDSVPEKGQVVRLGSAGNIAAGGESVEVLDETHESLLDLAVRAVQAFPGIDHCGLDIMGDHRVGLDGRMAGIVDVNTAPATAFHHFPMFGAPRDVSIDIVLRSCALVGHEPVARPLDELAVRIEVEGRVRNVGYRRWFASHAKALGVVGSIRNRPDGCVEAHIAGRTVDVAALASAAVHGPPAAAVTQVTTTHVSDVQPADRFEVQ